MPFTGRLGTEDSQWGNLFLGSEGEGDGRTEQSLQMRANIYGVSTQSLQMRAHITRPEATLQMRARIRGSVGLQMRARILGSTNTAQLTVQYNVQERVTARLLVQWDAGDKEPNYKSIQMRAWIMQTVGAEMTVRYEIDYTMPSACVVRPTQRLYLRTVRQFMMRARIVNN